MSLISTIFGVLSLFYNEVIIFYGPVNYDIHNLQGNLCYTWGTFSHYTSVSHSAHSDRMACFSNYTRVSPYYLLEQKSKNGYLPM